jgi:hypothetical protein
MVPSHQTQGLGPSQPVAGRSLRERFCERRLPETDEQIPHPALYSGFDHGHWDTIPECHPKLPTWAYGCAPDSSKSTDLNPRRRPATARSTLDVLWTLDALPSALLAYLSTKRQQGYGSVIRK